MRNLLTAFLVVLATPVAAQDAAPLKASEIHSGQTLRDSQSNRVGIINRINSASDGTVSSVKVIVDEKMVSIPGNTLRKAENGVITSLTRKEVRALD